MTALADAVLPLIRTREDLHRWSTANRHGARMHEAVDTLVDAAATADPAELYTVTHRALASAIKVIARSDDSSGIIGDACRRLLGLHPQAAAAADVAPARLVDWMIKFQFDGDVDYFELDPVAYAPALGATGMVSYRARLAAVEAGLGSRPSTAGRWTSEHSHEWFVLDWNAKRLAVLDHDVDAIVRTHAKDRRVAAWLHDAARAFAEIGEPGHAIDWARQALDTGPQHQSLAAADYWCTLLQEHRPEHVLDARLLIFRRWPTSATAASLHRAAGVTWPELHDEVLTALADSPREAVGFTLRTLENVQHAWELAHSLDLQDDRTWADLTAAYEKIDPLAVLPVLTELVENDLTVADARNYRSAARRLAHMRRLVHGTARSDEIDTLVAEIREAHRRRPRLQQELDRAGLP
ncbi:DUF6880 family protein [Georgenia sunbinii]|uniref:DUF6880 family protein n=1 Tax=Georgenia sunbinii TaxID=3117728 RepID=UPI002F26BCF0